jgi:radical SAM superfamily enzyme YgiQ (UPF0313 family)
VKNEVLLYFPGSTFIGSIGSLYPPLSLIPIGNVLRGEGYKAKIIDARLEDYRKTKLDDALYVGISSITGRQIKKGLEIARWVKGERPDLPVVWGGVHPSLLPEQTIEDESVDMVVRGEGERTCLELARTLENGKGLDRIRGLTYKEDRKIKSNPDRPFLDLDTETSDTDYSLVEKYENAYRLSETFHYTSSRGCPHRCDFCYNTKFCDNTWRSKSIEKIEEELKEIVERYHPKRINFLEDNFFVKKRRVEAICSAILREGYDIEWTADVRANYFDRFDRAFMETIRRSGCQELIVGAESGSPRILEEIRKDITVDQIRDAVKKSLKEGIGVFGLFMVGFPGETIRDVELTMNLIDELTRMDERRVKTTVSIFSPYPGTRLYDRVVRDYGFTPPESLEAWGDWNFSSSANTPWFDEEYRSFLEAVANIARVKSAKFEWSKNPLVLGKSIARSFFVHSGRLRWQHRFFRSPIEWKVWAMIQRWRGYA